MNTGICLKCGEKEVHLASNTTVEVAVALTWRESATLDYYVCTNCGYVELFVQDAELLPKIAEKYPKVI
jgi:predicted nucleic-acid-binding Zn-ribbon protein